MLMTSSGVCTDVGKLICSSIANASRSVSLADLSNDGFDTKAVVHATYRSSIISSAASVR